MERIIRINSLKLTKEFLKQPEEERKLRGKEILIKGFNKMDTLAPLAIKVESTIKLFERSIKVLEKEEDYESCEVLKQIMEFIPEVVEDIKNKVPEY